MLLRFFPPISTTQKPKMSTTSITRSNMKISQIFDALQSAKRLHKAGLKEEYAQAIAEEIKTSQSGLIDEIVTKEYFSQEMKLFRSEIQSEFRTEIQSIRNELKTLEYKLVIKMGAMISIAIAVVSWIVRLPH